MISNAKVKNQPELLNIKEAAALLNVSEISLRRWTDSGKLPCFRVGGKRERRFRRGDLLEFLESGAGVARPDAHAQKFNHANGAGVLLEGMQIEYGKHLCTLYETDKGRIKLSVPFLSEGLAAGDVCFLTADGESQAAILTSLSEIHGNLDDYIKDKCLVISEGMNSGAEMLDYLEQQFIDATRSGNRYLRVLGDMSWFIEKGLGLDELFDYEDQYNRTLGRQYPVVSLCQYDARKFSGVSIVNALNSHKDTFNYPMSRFIGV